MAAPLAEPLAQPSVGTGAPASKDGTSSAQTGAQKLVPRAEPEHTVEAVAAEAPVSEVALPTQGKPTPTPKPETIETPIRYLCLRFWRNPEYV